MALKLDILVIAAHPDDAEMSCGGTIAKHVAMGHQVGILDLTRGELGTRGTPEIRAAEAAEASQILGVALRHNLGFRDGFFQNDEAHQLDLIRFLRKYQPDIVLANAITDRHPDHGRGALLANDACFKSGLRMIETFDPTGNKQEPWRPKNVFHYIQDRHISPDFVVDISDFIQIKMDSIRAYRSQFYDPNSTEPVSYLTTPDFMDFLQGRAKEMGHSIGTAFGEGYTSYKKLGIRALTDLIT
jgi:N-acetylglucosamine malate deacetylase 1